MRPTTSSDMQWISGVRRALLPVFALLASVPLAANEVSSKPGLNAAEYIQTRTAQQDARIRALAQRGRQQDYEQLIKNGIPRDGFRFPERSANANPDAIQRQQKFEEITRREAAINVASLGYTTDDVAAYRRHNLDLFGMANRLFSASAPPEEQIGLADTVVVATSSGTETSRARLDGYLSALRFQVVRSLKGTPVPGDTLFIPQRSGVNPDGTIQKVTSDIGTTPGQTYLLVISRNWYEQNIAQTGKKPEIGFNALAFLVYEVSADGALKPFPRTALSGTPPRHIEDIDGILAALPTSKAR